MFHDYIVRLCRGRPTVTRLHCNIVPRETPCYEVTLQDCAAGDSLLRGYIVRL